MVAPPSYPIFRRFSLNYSAKNLGVVLALLTVNSSRRKAILKQAKQNQIKGTCNTSNLPPTKRYQRLHEFYQPANTQRENRVRLVRFPYVRCCALVESGERTLFGLVSSSGLAKQKLSLTIHELTVFSSSVCEMCRGESLERRLPPNGINDLCRGNGTGVGLAPLRAVTNSGHQWITWLPGLRRVCSMARIVFSS